MLFARNSKLANIEIYISFLQDIIEKDDSSSYKSDIINVIKMCHDISAGLINYSSVPAEIFDIVTFLSLNHTAFFANINPTNVSKEDIKTIKEFLEKDLFEIA